CTLLLESPVRSAKLRMLCWPYSRIALKMTILLAHNPMVSVRALKGGCKWKNQLFRVRDRPPVVPLYGDDRAFPRRPSHRLGGAGSRADPGGDEGGVPRRWRVRWDQAARDDARGGLGVCLPHIAESHGDVGRRDVSRRRVGGVSQAGAAHRA